MQKIPSIILALCLAINLQAKEYAVISPSGNIEVKVFVSENLSYSVSVDGSILGRNAKVKKAETAYVNETIRPVVQRKYATIEDEYNLMHLSCKGYSLQFRVYDEGAAYRWMTDRKGTYRVVGEEATFNFPSDHSIWFPEEEHMFSHQERDYLRLKLSDISEDRFCSTGMLVDCGNQTKVYISESDLTDYPVSSQVLSWKAGNKVTGMWYHKICQLYCQLRGITWVSLAGNADFIQ